MKMEGQSLLCRVGYRGGSGIERLSGRPKRCFDSVVRRTSPWNSLSDKFQIFRDISIYLASLLSCRSTISGAGSEL
jgi:hypothetical protein